MSEFKDKWLADLRSGNYSQGYKQLRRGDFYCCLGVAAEGQGHLLETESGVFKAPHLKEWALVSVCIYDGPDKELTMLVQPPYRKIQVPLYEALWYLNDVEKLSFDEIADYLQGIDF